MYRRMIDERRDGEGYDITRPDDRREYCCEHGPEDEEVFVLTVCLSLEQGAQADV